jgi:hypothetical protein
MELAFLQLGGETLCEFDVLAGIRNENFGHVNSMPWFGGVFITILNLGVKSI